MSHYVDCTLNYYVYVSIVFLKKNISPKGLTEGGLMREYQVTDRRAGHEVPTQGSLQLWPSNLRDLTVQRQTPHT